MKTVTSSAGGQITYEHSGSGPPLLLVHGTISDRSVWEPIRPALQKRFTVYAVNRRGRTGSAALDDVDFEREFLDVAAVVDAIGEPAHVLGHSFGAHCALGSALHTEGVRSLTLYEPPQANPQLAAVAAALRGLVDRDRREEAVHQFLLAGPGESEESIEALRRTVLWPTMLDLAPTIPLDLDALAGYRFDPERFATIRAPVAYLLGTRSPEHFRAVGSALDPVLEDFQWVTLPEQGHFANVFAPELFVEKVMTFLDGVE